MWEILFIIIIIFGFCWVFSFNPVNAFFYPVPHEYRPITKIIVGFLVTLVIIGVFIGFGIKLIL